MRSALTWLVKIGVSGGLLVWLLSRVDRRELWDLIQHASIAWLLVALALYLAQLIVSSWRWKQLLDASHVETPFAHLLASYLVATFFNNFLPSNIGGDVIRIRDTAAPCHSMTRAATIVLVDRAIGLVGLVFVAALGATIATELGDSEPFNPMWLWAGLAAGAIGIGVAIFKPALIGRLFMPLRVFHQEWVDRRIEHLTEALAKFSDAHGALARGFSGSLVVQGILVLFYVALCRAMNIAMPAMHLAVLVPMSFVVQMLPLSVNGFGVREYIFGFYFAKLGLPRESAIALSFLGAMLIMLFSVSGAIVSAVRRTHRPATETQTTA